jgi:hypothetical protein
VETDARMKVDPSTRWSCECEVVTWLETEVLDLLDASSVGLYEFIWILRGHEPPVSGEAARAVAEQALDELLADGEGRLVLLVWPSEDAVDTTERGALTADDWVDPSAGKPYVAIVRN